MPDTTTRTNITERQETLSKRRERLEELREELEKARARDERMSEEIAEKMAAGEEVNGLKEDRREVQELIEDLESALPLIEERIRDQKATELHDRAAERIRQIKKQVGGIAGELPRRAERAEERAEKLADTLHWLAHANLRRSLLKKEAEALADRFDLEVPPLKSFDRDPMDSVVKARRRVKSVSAPRDSLGMGDGEQAVGILERLFDVDSPTRELLNCFDELEPDAGNDGTA